MLMKMENTKERLLRMYKYKAEHRNPYQEDFLAGGGAILSLTQKSGVMEENIIPARGIYKQGEKREAEG